MCDMTSCDIPKPNHIQKQHITFKIIIIHKRYGRSCVQGIIISYVTYTYTPSL